MAPIIAMPGTNHEKCGVRQIVVVLYEPAIDARLFLRLDPDHYHQGLIHYKQLRQYWSKNEQVGTQPSIIDLRLPKLAFVK